MTQRTSKSLYRHERSVTKKLNPPMIDKEKKKARDKAYRQANKEKIAARDKAYRQAKKGKIETSDEAYPVTPPPDE